MERAPNWAKDGLPAGCVPRVSKSPQYEYGYLSVALNPRTGELFALLLPDMRVESFQAFIDEFIGFIGEKNACSPDHRRRGGASQHSAEDDRKTDN